MLVLNLSRYCRIVKKERIIWCVNRMYSRFGLHHSSLNSHPSISPKPVCLSSCLLLCVFPSHSRPVFSCFTSPPTFVHFPSLHLSHLLPSAPPRVPVQSPQEINITAHIKVYMSLYILDARPVLLNSPQHQDQPFPTGAATFYLTHTGWKFITHLHPPQLYSLVVVCMCIYILYT